MAWAPITDTALLETRYFKCFEQIALYFRGGGHNPVSANEIYEKFCKGRSPGTFFPLLLGGGKWEKCCASIPCNQLLTEVGGINDNVWSCCSNFATMREKLRKLKDTSQNSYLNESLALLKREKPIPLTGPHLVKHSLPCNWKHVYWEGPSHLAEHGKSGTVPQLFEDSERAYALLVSTGQTSQSKLPASLSSDALSLCTALLDHSGPLTLLLY